jgi:2-dehydropantoate 2-reductase
MVSLSIAIFSWDLFVSWVRTMRCERQQFKPTFHSFQQQKSSHSPFARDGPRVEHPHSGSSIPKANMTVGNLKPLRIGIVGAGAIGGHFAARLAQAGHSVSMLARGATLDALRKDSLRYRTGDGPERRFAVQAHATPADMGAQDLLILSVKGQALPALAPTLGPLLSDQVVVLTVGNGLPWWYFLVPGGALPGLRLSTVDPSGAIERSLPLEQVLGGTVMASCTCPQPGVVVHSAGGRVVIGEPGGGNSARAQRWASVLADADLGATASDDIRSELWHKLLGNASANPLSLLTGATTDRMVDDVRMHALFVSLMDECLSLGRRLGMRMDTDAAQRIAQTRKLGAIKTSMLQDLESGRGVELDAILGATLECADAVQHPMPALAAVFALACMRARESGVYPAGVS